MSTGPKVVGTYRTKEGLNMRIVADESRQGPVRYTLEQRMDSDKDALGVERWSTESPDDRGYDLLVWLGQLLRQGQRLEAK